MVEEKGEEWCLLLPVLISLCSLWLTTEGPLQWTPPRSESSSSVGYSLDSQPVLPTTMHMRISQMHLRSNDQKCSHAAAI